MTSLGMFRFGPAAVGAVVVALVGSALPVAQAAPKPDGTTFVARLRVDQFGTGADTCRVAGSNTVPESYVAPGSSGRIDAKDSRIVTNGRGELVAQVTNTATSLIVPTMKAGGLTHLSLNSSGSTSIWPSGTSATCGQVGGNVVTGTTEVTTYPVQPLKGAGWVSVTMTNKSSSSGWLSAVARLKNGKLSGPQPISVRSNAKVRFFAPANSKLSLVVSGRATATAKRPITQVVQKAWTVSVRATVTPIGAAITKQWGQTRAKRAVLMPAQVSCKSAKGWVTVQRYGAKGAKAVELRVNGKKVRALWQPKARDFAVKVPRKGNVKLTAKVTLNNGKKVSTSRRYVACTG